MRRPHQPKNISLLRKRLHLALQEVEMFHAIMEGMRTQLSRREMLKLIARSVIRGLGYDRVGIYLLSPDRKTLEHSLGVDEKGRFEHDRFPIPVGKRRGVSTMSDIIHGHQEYFFTHNIHKRMSETTVITVAAGVTCNANVPMKVGKGRIIGVLAVDNLFTQRRLTLRDIHSLINFGTQAGLAIESIRLQEKVRWDFQELKKLNRVKDDFLSVVSHELRTPLTSIIGYLKLLTKKELGSLNETQEGCAEAASRNAERLHHLVNDLLDLSRYESGRQTAQFGPALPCDILKAAREAVQNPAAVKGVRLEFGSPRDIGPILADAPKLEGVLINLVGNAVKFTPKDGLVTATCRECAPEGRPGIEFVVTDTGIGIPKELQSKVFDKFYQIEDHMTRNTGGSGLGLAICRHAVELHHGHITVESEEGKGSTFRVFIPRPPVRAKKQGRERKNGRGSG